MTVLKNGNVAIGTQDVNAGCEWLSLNCAVDLLLVQMHQTLIWLTNMSQLD